MKKHVYLTMLLALVLALGSVGIARAEIIPPHGYGQIGLEAIVLCEELTIRERASASSGSVHKLHYGDLFIVDHESDGWAYGFDSDSEYDANAGWVNSDYLIIDPARYRTEGKTPVYAWDSTSAPKVALLDSGTTLPILKQEGNWIVVSLRGASGWIRK